MNKKKIQSKLMKCYSEHTTIAIENLSDGNYTVTLYGVYSKETISVYDGEISYYSGKIISSNSDLQAIKLKVLSILLKHVKDISK